MLRKILCAFVCVLCFAGFGNPAEISDLTVIRQDHRVFAKARVQDFNRLDLELQKKADAFHNEMFFSPWHMENSRYTLEEVKWEFDKYGKDLGFGRNGKRHPPAWIKDLLANAQLDSLTPSSFPAITLRNTDLRVLPTFEAHLSSPRNSPLPFDNLQNSSVAAATPILVSRVSKDKKWVLAETHYAMGWLPAKYMAPVDAVFIKQWESGVYATIIKDKTAVYGKEGKLLFKAPLGTFFPKTGEEEKNIHILVAVAGRRGKAAARPATLTKARAVTKPLALTADNMAMVANQFMNEPYGWGGLRERRDCSSTLMDLFSTFGIWMPRNSGHQAKQTGIFIDLNDLTPGEKEKVILKQAIPYFTLIWLKGHIMLYIGSQDGRALVFHNFWSVKTRDAEGQVGKIIIGRTVITTLSPGRELREGQDSSGDILAAIRGMTLIWPPPTAPVEVPAENQFAENPLSHLSHGDK